jgi:hypothetical protein
MPAQAAVAAAHHASTNRLVQHMLHQAMSLTATNPPRPVVERKITSRQLPGQHWALLGRSGAAQAAFKALIALLCKRLASSVGCL